MGYFQSRNRFLFHSIPATRFDVNLGFVSIIEILDIGACLKIENWILKITLSDKEF